MEFSVLLHLNFNFWRRTSATTRHQKWNLPTGHFTLKTRRTEIPLPAIHGGTRHDTVVSEDTERRPNSHHSGRGPKACSAHLETQSLLGLCTTRLCTSTTCPTFDKSGNTTLIQTLKRRMQGGSSGGESWRQDLLTGSVGRKRWLFHQLAIAEHIRRRFQVWHHLVSSRKKTTTTTKQYRHPCKERSWI